jgi:1-deoxy-D-xylulose-5-phosphate reductoisomerase
MAKARSGHGCLRRIREQVTKKAIVLGSTGSIGRSTLDVLSSLNGAWTVSGLAARSRARELAQQANRLHPYAVAIVQQDLLDELRDTLLYKPRVFAGPDALVELLHAVEFDCVVCAVVGAAGLSAAVRAVELRKRLALASKEVLVVAGSLLMPLARKTGAEIVPVDSEHSAIFQALQAGQRSEVRKVYLTASGGPFRTWSQEAMESATLEDAMRHPTWEMGPKITIDSATMMNKALEIVEARWLFDLDAEQIEVVIHPESIIHSLVEFCDGSVVAQLSTPDMRTPIQYALTYPRRQPCPSGQLDLAAIGRLSFHAPDRERFPALRLGYEVARRGGTCGAVLNAANETAVELFRKGDIPFGDIARLTEAALHEHVFHPAPTLEELLSADRWARKEVARCTT